MSLLTVSFMVNHKPTCKSLSLKKNPTIRQLDGFYKSATIRIQYKEHLSCLKKSLDWFRIAKRKGDHEKMSYYVEGIQKFEKQLGLQVSSFSDIVERVEHTKTN